jgi:regulator of replication initiation timing
MSELVMEMKQKYPDFDITPQHLGHVLRDNNRTRKRTRHEHFPKERYKNPINKQTEMNVFYSKIKINYKETWNICSFTFAREDIMMWF